jgi:methyl-accepting chemotaxis protein
VDQINHAVEQMNQVVQQVAASAEESAGTATELSSQASQMLDMVQSFTMGADAKRVEEKQPMRIAASIGKAHAKPLIKPRRPAAMHASNVIPFDEDEGMSLREF